MPAILTRREEVEQWLHAPWEVAREVQRPLSDGALAMVGEPVVEAAQGGLL